MANVIATYKAIDDEAVEVQVVEIERGISVVIFDADAGEYLPCAKIFPFAMRVEALAWAVATANGIDPTGATLSLPIG